MKKYLAILTATDYEGSGLTLISSQEVDTEDKDEVLAIMMRCAGIEDSDHVGTIVLVKNGEGSPDIVHMWSVW